MLSIQTERGGGRKNGYRQSESRIKVLREDLFSKFSLVFGFLQFAFFFPDREEEEGSTLRPPSLFPSEIPKSQRQALGDSFSLSLSLSPSLPLIS